MTARLTRTRYWVVTTLLSVVVMGLVAADLLAFGDEASTTGTARTGLGLATALFALAGVMLTIRRLRDAGRSSWWSLLGAIPLVGGLLLLIQASRRDAR